MTDAYRRSRHYSHRRSMMWRAFALCVLALLTAACIDMEMDFVVHDDGSGSMTMTVSLDEAVLELAAFGEGGTAEELCREMLDDMDADNVLDLGLGSLNSSAEAVVSDGNCIVTMTAMWSAGESEEVLAAFAEDGGPEIRRLDDDGGWRFELDLGSLEDEDLSLDDLEMATAMGFDYPTLAISVTLPGDAVEHNAHSVSQSKYTWEIDLENTSELPEALYAETAPGGGLGPAAIGAIVAGVGLALAALVTLRRHREAQGAEADEPAAGPDETTDGDAEGVTPRD